MLKVTESGNTDSIIEMGFTVQVQWLPVDADGTAAWERQACGWGALIRCLDGSSPAADGLHFLFQQGSIGGGHLNSFDAGGIAQNEAQVGRPDNVLHKKCRGLGLFTEDPGHVGAGIEQHTHVQHHVAVMSEELDRLFLAIFIDAEVALLKVAGKVLLAIANREVDRDQVYLRAEHAFVSARCLRKGAYGKTR